MNARMNARTGPAVVTRKPVSRRAVLRGAGGIALALPWLEAMRPRRAGAALASVRRMVVWFTANGQNMDVWPPTGGETDFKLSSILAPLERHRGKLLIVQGLRNAQGGAHGWAPGTQLVGKVTLMEPAADGRPAYRGFKATGPSLDQHLVRSLGLAAKTKIPSLHLGTQVYSSQLVKEYNYALSWKEAQTPILAQENPYEVFKQIFGDFAGASAAEIDRVRAERRSILDSVRQNFAAFAGKLGAADRGKVDAHLEAVRQIEKSLEATADAPGGTCKVPGVGAQIDWRQNDNVPVIGKIQMDLLAAALACDLTRVASFQWASACACNRVNRWVPGITREWHGVSHDAVNGPAQMARIGTWYNEQLAAFLDRLEAVREGDRSLLDQTVVFHTTEYGPNVPDRASHHAIRMPYVLAGSCGGTFKTGRNLQFTPPGADPYKARTHNQLLVSLMNAMGVPGETFGEQAQPGPLPGLRG